MSSEDDYYHDRYDFRCDGRSSKRPRRRAYSPRRHRHFGSDFFPRKSRRNAPLYTQYAPRLAGLVILFVLIVYEVIVLRGANPAEDTSYTESQTTGAHVNTRSESAVPLQVPATNPTVADIKPESHETAKAPAPSESSFSPNSTTPASKPSTSIPEKENGAPVRQDAMAASGSANIEAAKNSATKHTHTAVPGSNSIHLPDSAIKLERKGADDDPDLEPGTVRKKKSSHTGTDSSSSPSTNDHTRSSKTTGSAENGTEPGAGENFWNWFQETKGGDKKTVSHSLACPEENKRLCQMLYKYIRKYKIRKVFDVSCEKNSEWVGAVLKKAGNELWGFKYYCSLWSGQNGEDMHKRLGGLPFVEFDNAKWWRAGFAADTELLFAWDTLPHLAYGRVWNFFVKARKQDIKYILVDNYPGILNDPSPKRDYLNLRKHPFRFPSAKEVAQNVTEPGETAKRQLLFYETSMLPDNLQ